VSGSGHLPPVLAAPGAPAALLPLRADPPIGTADDPRRRSTTAFIPPGAFLYCFTDGLVERRGKVIDRGIDTLAATVDKQIADPNPGGTNVTAAEDACAAVMRTLVGNSAAPDDIAILILNRHSGEALTANSRHRSDR
jgi:phosphoserine phosphatase RsbU/P